MTSSSSLNQVKGTHLGHELHQSCNMDFDAKCKRADFIDKSTDIRMMFSFAHPHQVLTAVSTYAGHLCEADMGHSQMVTQLPCGGLGVR